MTSIDPTVLERLDRDGYALLRGALDRATVARLRAAFVAAPHTQGTQHVRVDDATPERDAWLALDAHPAVLAAASHVLGGPARVRDAHGRNPLPGYGAQGLHTDWPARAPGAPYEVLTALFLLDDFTAANGATRVVPRTHLDPRPVPRSFAQPHARHADEVRAIGAAGDALLLNGYLWHAGARNESDGPRRVVQMVLVRA